MKAVLKTTGAIVAFATVSVLVLALAALLLIPLAIAAIALRRPVRDALSPKPRHAEDGDVIEGEWVVLALRERDETAARHPR